MTDEELDRLLYETALKQVGTALAGLAEHSVRLSGGRSKAAFTENMRQIAAESYAIAAKNAANPHLAKTSLKLSMRKTG